MNHHQTLVELAKVAIVEVVADPAANTQQVIRELEGIRGQIDRLLQGIYEGLEAQEEQDR